MVAGLTLFACSSPSGDNLSPPSPPSQTSGAKASPVGPVSHPASDDDEREEVENLRARAEWSSLQRRLPADHVPDGAMLRAHEAWRALSTATSRRRLEPSPLANLPPPASDWVNIGPAPLDPTASRFGWGNLAGRLTALAFAGTTLYAGFAQGGVWKSTDGGTTFLPLTDKQASLAIGALAVDPADPAIVYAGTGEGNLSGDAYFGHGLLKSTDGGATWTRPAGARFDGLAITKIQVDTTGAVYLATDAGAAGNGDFCTNFYANNAGQGLWKSSDGGANWTQLALGPVGDFEIDPRTMPRKIFFSVINTGAFSFTEGGPTTPLAGLPTANSRPAVGRIELALAPSSSMILYAGVELLGNPSSGTVYRSTNGGAGFAPIFGSPDYCRDQCSYDNVVTVHPTNPDIVYLGGSLCAVWATNTGTQARTNWTAISLPGGNCGNGGSTWPAGFVHTDTHAIVLDPTNPASLWVGSDGGLAHSPNGGNTWERKNDSFATNQFYRVCLHPTNGDIVVGGMQDNGVAVRPGNQLLWSAFQSGDGTNCVFNDANPDQVLTASQFAVTNLTTTNFTASTLVFDGSFGNCGGLPGCGDRVSFIAPMEADPNAPATVYIGTQRLWRTTNFGARWTPITGDLTAGVNALPCTQGPASSDYLNAIAIAPTQSTTIYVGSAAGQIRAQIAGAPFARVDKAPLPSRWVSALAVDVANPLTVYAGYSGFNAATPQQPGHVYRSDNGGVTWVSVDIGVDVPVDDVLADPITSGVVYVGTDLGVLWSSDFGATWAPLGQSLPNVAVYTLQMAKAVGRLVAGTHGRSAWFLQMYQPVGGPCVVDAQCLPGAGTCAGGVCCKTGCSTDMAVPRDMTAPLDLTPPLDLRALSDLTINSPPIDQSVPIDLSVELPDLQLPADLTVPVAPDFTTLAAADATAPPASDLTSAPFADATVMNDARATAPTDLAATARDAATTPPLDASDHPAVSVIGGCGCAVGAAPVGGSRRSSAIFGSLMLLALLLHRRQR